MTSKTGRLIAACVASTALAFSLQAQARPGGGWSGNHGGWSHGSGWNHGGWNRGGWGHRGYWGPGAFWGGIGLGLGIGALAWSSPYYGGYYAAPGYYAYPAYDSYIGDDVVQVAPAPVVVQRAPVVRSSGQPVPSAARSADPIFYPKSGQTAAQTETDRQDCNRWATTQPGAMGDASIFQRATYACMEGRGYVVR